MKKMPCFEKITGPDSKTVLQICYLLRDRLPKKMLKESIEAAIARDNVHLIE